MSAQKKRGLGRGLGALIPTGPEGDRPVDVFFPGGAHPQERVAAVAAVDAGNAIESTGTPAARTSTRSTSWDDALSSGRLAIRLSTGARSALAEVVDPVDPSATVDGAPTPDFTDADVTLKESSGLGPSEIGVIADLLPSDRETTAADVGGTRFGNPASTSSGGAESMATDHDSGTAVSVSRETLSDGSAVLDPDEAMAADDLLPVPGATFAELPVDAIRPNTWQPRTVFDETELDELVDSIKEIGVLQPIVVRRDKAGTGTYELIMGERRWRATQLAGLDTVPSIIRDTDDADMLRDALLENLHRAQLNPLEEAAAYRQLLDDFGCTHEELATRIARSRPQISNTLRLLKLPPLVQRRVAAGVLSAGHARALLSLADGAEIERLAQRSRTSIGFSA